MSEACSEVVVTSVARDRRQVATDLVALTKPRVVIMVLVTTLVGYHVGLTGSADYLRVIHLLIGTLLAAGAERGVASGIGRRCRWAVRQCCLPRQDGCRQ